MQKISKFTWLMLILACLSLAVTGCRGSALGGGTTTVAGSGAVGGAAAKGPFQQGSTVTAYQLNTDGTRSGVTVVTNVTDNLGTYTFANIAWSGMTEIEIVGLYLDENTGAVSAANGTVSAIINLLAVAAGVVSNSTVNPNIASTIAAAVSKQTLATTPAATPAALDALLQASNQQTAAALGIPTTDNNGVAIDLSTLSVTQTTDANTGTANQQLLAVSAGLLDAVNNQGAAGGNVSNLIASLATDINTGGALGTTSGSTAALVAGQATAVANVVTIANNITTAVTTANAVAGATQTVVDTTLTTTLATAATTVNTTATTVLRGFALAGNTFTMGSVTYNVAATGVSTAGAGVIAANNVVLGLTFMDYSNTAGTGVGPATKYPITLTFKIASTADARVVTGDLFPVNVVTDGLGRVSMVVPAGAVLNFSGVDSVGVAVAGTASNIAANTIQNNANIININVSNLLTTIQNKVGAQAAVFNVLKTAGNFTFEFGIAGLNVGSENAGMNGLASLLPTSTVVAGRSVSGTITTQ